MVVVIAGVVAIAAVVAAIVLARHERSGWAVLLGLVLIGSGIAAFLIRQPYGWFAYAPLSNDVFISAPLGTLAISGLMVGAAGFFALGCGVTGLITHRTKPHPGE
jgi:heme/copper-type cytochrome/quinol oxidase subunit 1